MGCCEALPAVWTAAGSWGHSNAPAPIQGPGWAHLVLLYYGEVSGWDTGLPPESS